MSETVKQPTDAISLFSKSLDLVKRNLNTFLIINALSFIFAAMSSFKGESNSTAFTPFGSTQTPSNLKYILGVGLIVALIIAVAMVIFSLMNTVLMLRAAQDKTPTINELWETVKKYGFRLIGLGIVSGLAIIGGLILFIIPGIIQIRRYILAPYVMLDKDLGILDSMSEAARISKPYSWSVYSVLLVSLVIAIVGSVLSAFLGVFGSLIASVLAAIYAFAIAIRYVELKKLSK